MRLKNKISIISVISIIVFCIITILIQKVYILPTYKEIEQSEAGKDICQAVDFILEYKKRTVQTAFFIRNLLNKHEFRYKNVINKNLKKQMIQISKKDELGFCGIFNRNDEVKFSYIDSDYFDEKGEITILENSFKLNNVLFKQKAKNYKSGLISTPVGLMIIAAFPLLKDSDLYGTLVTGYFIDKNLINKLSENIRSEVSIFKLSKNKKLTEFNKKKGIESNSNFTIYYSKTSDKAETLQTFVILPGINSSSKFVVSTLLSRLIYLEAHSMIKFALYVLIIFGVLLIFIASFFIHILVVKPISKLTNSTVNIRESENLSLRTKFDIRKDEVGILSSEFNELLAQLQYHIEDMEEIIQKQTEEIRLTREDTIFRISMAIDDKNIAAGRHITRVSKMVILLSEKLNISKKKRDSYGIASTMHDIGKIGIPEELVSKSGKYTEEEYNTMKAHTIIGGKIFSNGDSQLIKAAYNISKYHHERWDGNGYPEGLKGENIPVEARITSIVDVFDAMLSKKSYKEAHSLKETVSFFTNNIGKMFDPNITEIFLDNIKEFEELREKYPDNV